MIVPSAQLTALRAEGERLRAAGDIEGAATAFRAAFVLAQRERLTAECELIAGVLAELSAGAIRVSTGEVAVRELPSMPQLGDLHSGDTPLPAALPYHIAEPSAVHDPRVAALSSAARVIAEQMQVNMASRSFAEAPPRSLGVVCDDDSQTIPMERVNKSDEDSPTTPLERVASGDVLAEQDCAADDESTNLRGPTASAAASKR